MKALFLIFTLLIRTALAEDLEFQRMREWSLEEKIAYVQRFQKDDRSAEWRRGMKALSFHLAGNYSMNWQGDPKGLPGLRHQLEELRPLILDLAYSESEVDRRLAVSIGKYLTVDDGVESMLFHVLEEGVKSSGQSKDLALEAIFGYDLETTDLKDELLKELSLDQAIAKSARYQGGTYLYAGRWGLEEASPLLMSLVEKHYDENKNAKHGSLQALKEMGPSAKEVLPRLEALYEQRKKDGDADFREIEAFEFAIASISKPVLAGGKERTTNGILSERALKPSRKDRADGTAFDMDQQESQKTSSLPWIIAGVLVVVALSLLLKSFRGKSMQ